MSTSEVEALKETLLSLKLSNLTLEDVSTIFLLGSTAYAGGFFFNKILNTYLTIYPGFSYSASTVCAFSPYIRSTYRSYQYNLSIIKLNKARSTLIASDTWDIDLFINYMRAASNHVAQFGGFEENYDVDPKMRLMKKVVDICRAYITKTSRGLLSDFGASLFHSLIKIYGNLENASQHVLFLSQRMEANRNFSKRGCRMNNFLIDYQVPAIKQKNEQATLRVPEEIEAGNKFINMITNTQMSLGEMYTQMYEYSIKDESTLVYKK